MPERKNTRPIDNSYGHLQPQATDMEHAVLGALMIDKDAFYRQRDTTPRDFL